MKIILLLSILSVMLSGVFIFAKNKNLRSPSFRNAPNATIECSASYAGDIAPAENGKFIIPLPGWGHYGYSISTANDSAQFYFNQGLNMYYSYHPREATASFKEAARFDPQCPMTYWGEALSMGPNYNSAHGYQMSQKVPEVLLQMNQATGNVSQKEKDLISAMNSRYPVDAPDIRRDSFNMNYATRLRELVSKFPDDPDIKVFYIDAVMLIHPWDFWNNDGSKKNWTAELLDLCQSVLKTNPSHPAALHYYIHLTEASRHPEVALADADLLRNLLPGVAHMVHMSSHEYERNGLFAKGVEVNDQATDNLVFYDSIAKNINLNKRSPHYFAVQTYCAMSGGMYKVGIRDALRCRSSVSPSNENIYDQYLYMLPNLTRVRLGKWQEILSDPVEPDLSWSYAGVLYNFSRGLAYVYTDQMDSASKCFAQLCEKAKDTMLCRKRIPFNTPLQSVRIAEKILNGVILFAQKKYEPALASFEKAVGAEDSLIYTEPKDWPIPARQFLGAYLLKLHRAEGAEKIYRDDLFLNPGNGWSLLGLCQSLEAQHKTQGLAEYRATLLTSFPGADRAPTGSVFMFK